MQGFFVYLLALTGQLVVTGSANLSGLAPAEAGAEQDAIAVHQGAYFRIAAFSSLMSFAAGYNPSVFARLIGTVSRFAHGDDSATPE